MTKFTFSGNICDLLSGIKELANDFSYELCTDGISVSVTQKDSDKLSVKYADNKAEIIYNKKYHFFRALGLLIEHLRDGESEFDIEETAYFTMNGPMFDVSHANSVINIKSSKKIIRQMAIMGLNMLMMYCEDNFYIPEQPYFGYMRPRYTDDDLRTLDEYADMFGIEMIPCIQTLAHLQEALKWKVFNDVRGDEECLLVGEEKTYELVRQILVSASRPFKTKKIHIGMDEAWNLGQGKYQQLHGVVPKVDIMIYHLNRVMEIVRELGLEPIMWSDMFFRALSKTNSYYDKSVEFTEKIINAVPKDVRLVYWDYYQNDSEDTYNHFIDKHREIGEPIFAGGIWTWFRFGANYTKMFRTMTHALMACKKKGIRDVFATTWGDGATESSIYTTMFGVSFFAEHGYEFDLTEEKFRKRFEFCCNANYDDFMNLRFLDETPGVPKDNMNCSTTAKALMWQDILAGMFDKNIEGLPMNEHYEKLAASLLPACERNGEYNSMFKFKYALAHTLAKKAEMGLKLTSAYKSGDKSELRRFADEYLPELKLRIKALHDAHMAHWYDIYKSFGWNVMDVRYGTSLIRIDSIIDIINMYLDGKLETIEELDEPRLLYNNQKDIGIMTYEHIASASRII